MRLGKNCEIYIYLIIVGVDACLSVCVCVCLSLRILWELPRKNQSHKKCKRGHGVRINALIN